MIMKNIITAAVFILVTLPGISQNKNKTAGIEIDALPYLTGGYYGSIWIGNNHMRYRAIVTKVTTPKFILEDGFTENKIHAYTLIADYFFKPNFQKWWVGAGFEYWEGQIQTEAKLSTAKYDNIIFTSGGGYVWKFYRNFYLNPWTGVHIRVAGDKKVMLDGKEFSPALFTPEISLKIGWHF